MRVKEFFSLLEKSNEFKSLLGELPVKLHVKAGDFHIGTVASFEEFALLLGEELHPDAMNSILLADIEPSRYLRQFVIKYRFDGRLARLTILAE